MFTAVLFFLFTYLSESVFVSWLVLLMFSSYKTGFRQVNLLVPEDSSGLNPPTCLLGNYSSQPKFSVWTAAGPNIQIMLLQRF